MKKLLKYRLPDIRKIEIDYFDNENPVIKDFLSISFP